MDVGSLRLAPASLPRGIIAIPARMASTRLPNKLLLRETGRPLLAHVIDRSLEAVERSEGLLAEVVIAHDDERLGAVAVEAGVRAVKTGVHHRCGTTRIAEAVQTLGDRFDFVVNVQGDEPELAPEAIIRVAEELLRDPTADMATLALAVHAETNRTPSGEKSAAVKKLNPNAVKAVLDARGKAIYFSRAPVPYDRNAPAPGEPLWHHHLGIYAYRWNFLQEFASWPPSALEEREGLEQLRAIEAGRTIKVGVIPHEWAGKGIDTPEDYTAFVGRMKRTAA